MKIAIAQTGKSKLVARYLPSNYKVLGRTLDVSGTIIIGVDSHGWTLDDYVIPRLASALITCKEVTEIDGYSLKQRELQFESKKRGRKRALTDEDAELVRHIWIENDREWQVYRSNPSFNPKPFHLTISDLAKRFRVSEGVITDVINRTGAYK